MTPKTGPRLPTLAHYVHHHADRDPGARAVLVGDEWVGFGALAAAIDRTSRGLIAAGIAPGDRVALLSTARPSVLVHYLAATQIGAVWMGLNPKYTPDELAYVIGHAQPRLLQSLPTDLIGRLGEARRLAGSDAPLHALPDGPGLDALPDAFTAGIDAVTDEQLSLRRDAVATDDTALLVYTSGSTGKPKGSLLRHSGLVRLGRVQTAHYGADPTDTLADGPINHVAVPGDMVAMTLVSGGGVVLRERFDAGETLAVIERERLTVLMSGPTQLQRIADHPRFAGTDLTSLKRVVWGGAALPRDTIAAYRAHGLPLTTTYGSSEATSSVTYADNDADDETLANTVGRPDPELDVRLLTTDGRWAGPDEPGEVCLRHPTVMRGYLGDDAATAAAFTADGYLRMGDIGVLRPDGNLRLVGRTKEMFKSGGYNVYPREIELVLEAHPAVRTAAVVARPDREYQEVGVGFVEVHTAADPGEVLTWARSRLANYKVPKDLVVLERLPTLPNEKIDKRRLAAIAHGDVA